MAGRFLLDTNIVIALLASERQVSTQIAEASEVFLTPVIIGELHYGARGSQKPTENLARINALAARIPVLPIDVNTAHTYGVLKTALRRKGRPIPENDIWIAASAVQHRLVLVTRDEHFTHVNDVETLRW